MKNGDNNNNNNNDKILGFDRNIFFAGVTSFFTDTGNKLLYSVMPLFLLSIGASKTSIALIEGIAESTAAFVKIISGRQSDKTGKKKPFLIAGYGAPAVITPLYALAATPVGVLILRFLERIGKGLRAAPRDALISASAAGKDTGKSFGFHKAMDNSGAIVGPFIAFLLLSAFHSDFRTLFLIAAIPAVIGVLIVIFFIRETATGAGSGQKQAPVAQYSFSALPTRFRFFTVIVFVFTLGNSADALLLVRTTETGISETLVPLVYMIFNVVSVIVSIPVGKLSDKIGREKLILAGFLIYACCYFFFGYSNDIRVFAVVFAFYGLYLALVDVSQRSLISDIVGKELKGTAYGIYYAALGIGLLPASLIAGLLYDRVSSGAPFFFGSGMSLIAALLMFVFTITGRRI